MHGGGHDSRFRFLDDAKIHQRFDMVEYSVAGHYLDFPCANSRCRLINRLSISLTMAGVTERQTDL